MKLIKNDLSVNVTGLNKKFKGSDFNLSDIDIQVPYGTIVGTIGRNGAGKTTAISCILGMMEKDTGNIEILGENFTGQINIKNEIGVVLDEPNFSLLLTPRQINKIMKNIYAKWNEDIFNDYLSRFGLPLDNKTKCFSFGMKKKLSLAIALAHETKLLILDEVTSGLDPVSRNDILCVLLEFIGNPNCSVYLSSHITSDLERIADYIVFMDNGKVILSEEKDLLIYNYGILRCLDTQFEKIDKEDIIAYKTDFERVNILIKDRGKLEKKYQDMIINKPTLDEMLLILVENEVNA